MFFIMILILSALSLAGAAAYFSVFGLAQIFAGSFTPVIVMGGVLEAGKLVAASFAYRYWNHMRFLMRTYLITAIVVLMVITSMGVFGFLSTAYQKDILPLQLKKQKIVLLEQEKNEITQLRDERLGRKQQIDADIAALPNDFVTGRRRLLEAFGPELKQLKIDLDDYALRLQEINAEIYSLKNATLIQEAHIGPIVFIAKAFNRTTDDTTKWMIFLIIFAFDPLAVMLTIGANLAIMERQKKREQAALTAAGKRQVTENAAAPKPAAAQQDTSDQGRADAAQKQVSAQDAGQSAQPAQPARAAQSVETPRSSAPNKPTPSAEISEKISEKIRQKVSAEPAGESQTTVRQISELLNMKLASAGEDSENRNKQKPWKVVTPPAPASAGRRK